MRPPSSCPTGNRLSAVTKRPTQPASATGCTKTSIPAGIGPNTIQVSSRMSSESPKVMAPCSGSTIPTRDHCRPRSRAGIATTSPASGPATAMSKSEFRSRAGRPHADDRAHGAEQEERRRRRDEERQAHRRPVVAGREVVAELVGAQDGDQREREGHAVEQAERPEERVEGHEREGAADQAARRERGEHGEHEEQQVEPGARGLLHVGERHRPDPHQVALAAEEGRVAETLQARLDQGERARGLHEEAPAPAERRPPHLLALDAEDVLDVAAQQILDDRVALRGRAVDPVRGRERKGPEAHARRLPHGQTRDGRAGRVRGLLPDRSTATTASSAVASTDSFARPPICSSPRPRRRCAPRSSAAAQRARFSPETSAARRGVSTPTGSSGAAASRRSATTRASTASPRSASRSLSGEPGFSFVKDRWVSACRSSSGSRKGWPRRAPSTPAGSGSALNAASAPLGARKGPRCEAGPEGPHARRSLLYVERAAEVRNGADGAFLERPARDDTSGGRWWRSCRRSRTRC